MERRKISGGFKTLNQEGVENLQATLLACDDLERQATRLKQLVDGFRT